MACETVDFSNLGKKFDSREDAQEICNRLSPSTEKLILAGNSYGIEAAAAIGEALASCPNLKYAYFKDMFTGRLKSEVPPALKHLFDGIVQSGAKLIELDVSDNAFGPHGAKELRPFLESSSAERLQVLLLNNLGLGIGGSSHMAPSLKRLTNLRVIMCGRNRLEVEGTTAIAESLSEINTIQELAMYQNGIRPRGIEAISLALQSNPDLHSLNLMDNTIKLQGARALTRVIERCKSLKSLNLADCLLKNSGALVLLDSLKDSTSIQDLDLSGNELGDADLVEKIQSILFNRPGLNLNLSSNCFGHLADCLIDNAVTKSVELTLEDDEGTEDEEDNEEGDQDGDDDDDQDEGDDESYEEVNEEYAGNGHEELNFTTDQVSIDDYITKFFAEAAYIERSDNIPRLRKLLEQAKSNTSYPLQLSNSILIHLGLLKEESTKKYRKVGDVKCPLQALIQCVDILDQKDRQTLSFFLTQKQIPSAADSVRHLLTRLNEQ